jgi:alpha/beta superfamily hydrolase
MASGVRTVRFASANPSELQLEGALKLPDGRGPFPAAVLAHPHPQWGGTMDVPLLHRIADALADRGWAALRFNFRGVGGSRGAYDEGRGETEDLLGALDWVTSQDKVDAGRLAVVGYSFGAWIAGRVAARDDRVRAYAAVALPMSEPYRVDLSRFTRPKGFITGEKDPICPSELLRQYVGALPDPKTLRVLPDADHFLMGYEQTVAKWLMSFLTSAS